MKADLQAQRVLVWSALITAALYCVGYYLTGMFPPPSPLLGSADVLNLYSADVLQVKMGVVICLTSAGFYIPWSVAVARQMSRHEEGYATWSTLQLVAGALGCLTFVLPAFFWGVAAFSVERNPDLTLLMHEIAYLALVTPISFFPFQVIPMVVISFRQKDEYLSAFPRWIGYFSLWMLAIGEMGVLAQVFKIGPFAWNGAIAFWLPLTAFTLWICVICRMILRASYRQSLAS